MCVGWHALHWRLCTKAPSECTGGCWGCGHLPRLRRDAARANSKPTRRPTRIPPEIPRSSRGGPGAPAQLPFHGTPTPAAGLADSRITRASGSASPGGAPLAWGGRPEPALRHLASIQFVQSSASPLRHGCLRRSHSSYYSTACSLNYL